LQHKTQTKFTERPRGKKLFRDSNKQKRRREDLKDFFPKKLLRKNRVQIGDDLARRGRGAAAEEEERPRRSTQP
jgi:hypothetical protein